METEDQKCNWRAKNANGGPNRRAKKVIGGNVIEGPKVIIALRDIVKNFMPSIGRINYSFNLQLLQLHFLGTQFGSSIHFTPPPPTHTVPLPLGTVGGIQTFLSQPKRCVCVEGGGDDRGSQREETDHCCRRISFDRFHNSTKK